MHYCPPKLFFISIILFFFLLPINQVAAQKENFIKRYINKIINDTTDIREPQFLAYPTIAYAPETSWEFGISSLFVYYSRKDTTNRLSEINGFTFYTLENQYGA